MAILKYDNLMRAHELIKKTLAFLLILSFAAVAARGEAVTLTLYPTKIAEPAQKYRLLVKADNQTDADAAPLYEKAIQLMPKDTGRKQIREWLNLPVEKFPQEKVEEVIQKHLDSLRLAAQASRYKKCKWPEWKPGMKSQDLNRYKDLASVIRLWTRLEIYRDQYESALVAMQTSFGMARHLGQAPTIVQTLVGATVGGLTCREIEQFVQGKDSPNLYVALAEMPEPFADMEKAIKNEGMNLKEHEPALRMTRIIAKRLDNHLNALQVVEAIRNYAAAHDGQLPQVLSDIKDMEIPNDLVGKKAFEYHRTASGATLQSAIPEGGNERDAAHYVIVIEK